MRSISACLLLVAGGCSMDMVSTPSEQVPLLPGPGTGITGTAPQQATASICRVNAWTNMFGIADDVSLAVAPSPNGGAVVVQTPRTGGYVSGFAFDQYGLVASAPTGTMLREGAFTSVSATFVDGQLLTESTNASSLRLDAVASDLTSVTPVAAFDGSFAGRTPVLHARAQLIAPNASKNGVSFAALDSQYHQTSNILAFADPTIAMDSAQIGGDTGDLLVAWTTEQSCFAYRMLDEANISLKGACETPRVAYSAGRELLAFQSGGKVSMADLTANNKAFETPGYGKQPRIASDGKLTWLAYIDDQNNVIAGFFDRNGNFTSTTVDIQPGDGAYELAMVNGAMSVFAEDHRGVYQFELCADGVTE